LLSKFIIIFFVGDLEAGVAEGGQYEGRRGVADLDTAACM
jgi:hypothetical protein